MTLRKTKSEDRTLPAWLDALVSPLYLDFVASMPLEEALQRIKTEEQQGFFRYRTVRVDLIPYDADTFGFVVKKSGSKYATTEAHGLLKRWDKNTTQVTGKVNLSPLHYWTMPLMLVVLVIYLVTLPANVQWFSVIFVGIILYTWFSMRQNRHDVAQLVLKALKTELNESPIHWKR
jgi:hypothetical protein